MVELSQAQGSQAHRSTVAPSVDADSFHRLAKSLLDSGEAKSLEEAMEVFSTFGVRVRLPRALTANPVAQIIALTVINAASRSFEGNIVVDGEDSELTVRGFEGSRISDFLQWARVKPVVGSTTDSWPTISVGDIDEDRTIHAWANGWRYGIGPGTSPASLFVPSCIAAGGLAVSEAFSVLRRDNPYVGRRRLHLSLWDPRSPEADSTLPVPHQQALWLVGLGHLGQAYAWGLGFMEPGDSPLLLQDTDEITESTLSTSMLSIPADVGSRKTRIVGRWLEARGYSTSLIERRFDEHHRLAASDPSVALFGVDNRTARRCMEGCGFRTVIDAGLGAGFQDFRSFRLRVFPGLASAAKLWAGDLEERPAELPSAYKRMLGDGAEPCGVTVLATRAVGAPFVGCVAAGYVLAERIRRQIGGLRTGFIDMNLRDPRSLALSGD